MLQQSLNNRQSFFCFFPSASVQCFIVHKFSPSCQQRCEENKKLTHEARLSQMARAVLRRSSSPCRKMRSHTLMTVSRGRQLLKSVRNHCMVNTLVRGGSQLVPAAGTAWLVSQAAQCQEAIDNEKISTEATILSKKISHTDLLHSSSLADKKIIH